MDDDEAFREQIEREAREARMARWGKPTDQEVVDELKDDEPETAAEAFRRLREATEKLKLQVAAALVLAALEFLEAAIAAGGVLTRSDQGKQD